MMENFRILLEVHKPISKETAEYLKKKVKEAAKKCNLEDDCLFLSYGEE